MTEIPKTMRALTLHKAEGRPGQVYHPAVVEQVPTPIPEKGQVLVHLLSSSFNHRDLYIRQSLYPGIIFSSSTKPSIFGADGYGILVSPPSHPLYGQPVLVHSASNWLTSCCGPDVPGQPFGILGNVNQTGGRGTFAEYICAREDHVVSSPKGLGEEAAAFPLAGVTAWRAVVTKGKVKRGDNVLVTGIGGGVAILAVQIAVALGANVYVTSSSETKISSAIALGAKGGVNYKDEKWPQKLVDLLPPQKKTLDVIVDSAGGKITLIAPKIMKPGGIIVSYGNTLGGEIPITMHLILQNIEFKGSTMGSLEEFKEFVKFAEEKQIKPVIDKILDGLENAEEGFEALKTGSQFGKIILRINKKNGGKL